MSAPIKISSFVGGEIAPFLYGRTDQVKYETGLRKMRNFIAMRHGGATQRPGTQYVATTLNSGAAVRLIPFIFNETGNGQSYLLEFGQGYIAFYQNGGVVINAGNPYTISSPYQQADLQALNFVESGDIITIVHPSYAPRELKRLGATNWTLTVITTGSAIAAITGMSSNLGPTIPPFYSETLIVTAVSASGEESDPTSAFYTTDLSTPPSATNPLTITWNAVTGAAYYRIYKAVGYSTTGGGGFIGTSQTPVFADIGVAPDYSNTPPILNTLFNSAGNYPSAVGFVQQRRAFANTNNNPIGFWISRVGSYANFDFRNVPIDSDAIIGSVAGSEINAIQNILELKFMLMLTAGAEVYVQGNGSGVVTPSAINAAVQSQYGCTLIPRPLKAADTVLFVQALGNVIRDLGFDFAINGYRGNDLTVFSSHLFEGHGIIDWDFQKIPDSIVWVARDDGTLLGLTYVREQQILAWHRHDFTNGFVENVCCIPENGQYAVYLSIRRVINGSTVRYIERMSSRIWTDVLTATYLDCWASFNGVNSGSTTMALSSPTGAFTQDGTAYQQSLILTASAGFFTSGMVGDQIFIEDALFVANAGQQVIPSQSGNQIRCTITSYNNSQQVMVTPNRAVPANLQAVAVTTWAHAVNSVSGLSYLAGQQVSVYADRFVVASPNNSAVSFKATVSPSGTLALDKNYAVIYVGLPMTADIETLDVETSFGETLIPKRKRQNRLGIYLLNSRTLFAGSEDPDSNLDNLTLDPLFQMFELKTGTGRQVYDAPPVLSSDQDFVIEDTRYNKNGRIFIRNVDPIPLTILAISYSGDLPGQSPPWAEKV